MAVTVTGHGDRRAARWPQPPIHVTGHMTGHVNGRWLLAARWLTANMTGQPLTAGR